ncbi:MAG TPA: DUF2127 domain-containing protein [Streptosporangiaceae bacterium]|nr:DUF2127 domain-containing protein [Streptosporangiaceae bacterium]
MDWSTFGCGRTGHVTFAPDEAELRAEMGAALPAGTAWQCLRCGVYVPGTPARSGPAASAPVVPRGKELRSVLILRLFAIERFVRAILAAAVSVALWRYVASRASIQNALNRDLPLVRDLFRDLGFNVSHSKLYVLVQHALTLSPRTVTLVAIGAVAYAALEVAEGVGLWLARRWGEYLAMVATSLGLPLEIYDLTRKVSVIALVLLALNLVLVLYLVITKRLFGVRGGKEAYDARLRSESVLGAAQKAAAARRAAGSRSPASAGPPTVTAKRP